MLGVQEADGAPRVQVPVRGRGFLRAPPPLGQARLPIRLPIGRPHRDRQSQPTDSRAQTPQDLNPKNQIFLPLLQQIIISLPTVGASNFNTYG